MVIWRRLSSLRSRALLLSFVALLSLLSSFLPFFSQSASALTADDVLNRARAWSILNAVVDSRSHTASVITPDEANTCDFFNLGWANDIYVGHHVTGDPNDDGITSNGASWNAMEGNAAGASSALASVGINGGCRGLLEKIGYVFAGGNLVQPNDFGNKLSERIRNAVAPDAFFGAKFGDESPGDALSYAMMYYDLTHVCGWSYRNPFVLNDTSQTTEGSRNREAQQNGAQGNHDGHFHTITYENGTVGDNTYFKSGGREDGIRVGSRSGFANDAANTAKIDCGGNTANTVGAKLQNLNHGQHYADAYAALLKPGGAVNPGTCKDRYDGKPAELAACDAGFKNRDNQNYCRDTYPPQDQNATLREACNYGAGPATGGADTTTPAPGSSTSDSGGNTTTCAIEVIGWILCPILNFMGSITDGAYSFIEEFLKIQPFLSTGSTEGIYLAWQVMRNFANVVFVIVFLIIIFSQVTGFGINNYGIKRMLPRLIVAAILVNVSYWICALAVDLSNIAGSSLKSLFDSIARTISVNQTHSVFSTGDGWVGIVGGLLGGTILVGTALFVGLSALVPALGLALVAVLFIFLILIIRQILVTLLVVISPLAFVAYLLPNTEPLFTRWRRLFQTLLLVYPITGLIFGASALASVIISSGAN